MKLQGARLILWSAIALVIGQVPAFMSQESMFALGFVGSVLSGIGSLAFVGLIAGLVIYFKNPTNESEAAKFRRTKFWIGVTMAVIGLGLPAVFAYEMLFVAGGADAIFMLMIFGPLCLIPLVFGIVLMVRNRQ
ncbi:MAG: hypothetical protein RL672_1004 [Actinomycetota bacterium]